MARLKLAVLMLIILTLPVHFCGSEIKLPQGKGTIQTRIEKGQEAVALSDLVKAMGGRAGKDQVSQYPTWEIGGHRVVFSTNTAMVSVDGKIVSLKSTPVENNGDLLLGTEFIQAVFPKLGFPVEDLPPEKAAPPKSQPAQEALPDGVVTIEKTLSYDLVRITFKGSMVSLAEIKKDGGQIKVRLPRGKAAIEKEKLGEGVVTEMFQQDDGREIVFTLDKGFRNFETVNLKNPERLILMIKGEGQKPPKDQAPSAPADKPATPSAAPAKKSGKILVVLDPGHGGQDTGALGKEGTVEKALTLDFTAKLKDALEKEGIDVLLTRNGDVFIPLKERTAIANYNKADIFLSIHFNASPLKSVKGSESYIMSREATDLWSKELAEKENISIGGEEGGNGLSLILWNLAQNQYIVESTSIAGELQQSLNALFGTNDRGVRQAPFAVLEGAQMPAVLLEIAFLSNAAEAKEIQNKEFADGIIKAVVSPLVRFKDRSVPPSNN
jgi:N-acetylmuramoyl-L-alanine amidase